MLRTVDCVHKKRRSTQPVSALRGYQGQQLPLFGFSMAPVSHPQFSRGIQEAVAHNVACMMDPAENVNDDSTGEQELRRAIFQKSLNLQHAVNCWADNWKDKSSNCDDEAKAALYKLEPLVDEIKDLEARFLFDYPSKRLYSCDRQTCPHCTQYAARELNYLATMG